MKTTHEFGGRREGKKYSCYPLTYEDKNEVEYNGIIKAWCRLAADLRPAAAVLLQRKPIFN